MQTSLLFVDLTSQGLPTDIGKIAIKMPKGQGELNADAYGGFADIINSLMSTVPPEELQESLDQLEWVPMEDGGASGLVPLFDLTQEQSKAFGVARRLLNEAVPETARPLEKMMPVLLPVDSTADSQKADGGAEPAAPSRGFWQRLGDMPNRPDQSLLADAVRPFPVEKESNPAPLDPQSLSDMKSAAKGTSLDREALKPSVQDDAVPKQVPEALPAADRLKTDTKREGTDRSLSQMASQDTIKVRSSTGMEMGQHSAGEQEGDAELSTRHNGNTGKQVAAEMPGREFKPGLAVSALERSLESNEVSDKNGIESRDHLQQASMARAKSSGVERMESVTGGKETGTPTQQQDLQTNVIRQIVQRMTLQTQGTQSTMTVKLKPEFLGNVQMQISTDNHQVVVRMATESMAVKEMVEQGLQHLKTELQQHGLEIDKFDVFVANDNEESKQGQDWAGFRQALKRRQRDGLKQNGNEKEPDDDVPTAEKESRRSPNSTGEVDYFA